MAGTAAGEPRGGGTGRRAAAEPSGSRGRSDGMGRLLPAAGGAAGRAAAGLRRRVPRPPRRLHGSGGAGEHPLLPVRRRLQRLRRRGRGAGAAAGPELPPAEAAGGQGGGGRGGGSPGRPVPPDRRRGAAGAVALPCLAAPRMRPGRGHRCRPRTRRVLFLPLPSGGLRLLRVPREREALWKQGLPGLQLQPARGRDRRGALGLPRRPGVPAERRPRAQGLPNRPQTQTEARTILRALERCQQRSRLVAASKAMRFTLGSRTRTESRGLNRVESGCS